MARRSASPSEVRRSSPRRLLAPTKRPSGFLGHYTAATRRREFNIIMVVGLLAAYEAAILFTGSNYRNAADAHLKSLLLEIGSYGPSLFHGALLLLFVAAAARSLSRGHFVVSLLPLFFAECALYAAFLAPAVLWLQQPLLASPGLEDFWLDIGAGVYEEIVFRFLLIRGGFWLLRLDPFTSEQLGTSLGGRALVGHFIPVTALLLISAVVFAAYHHVGAEGEPFDPTIFLFRALAGLVLSFIYLWRGLAAAVYSHAFYDVFVHFAQ